MAPGIIAAYHDLRKTQDCKIERKVELSEQQITMVSKFVAHRNGTCTCYIHARHMKNVLVQV